MSTPKDTKKTATKRAGKPKSAADVVKAVAPKKGARSNKVAQEPKPIPERPPMTRGKDPVGKPELPPLSEETLVEALEELSPKEIEFCEAYLACFNGTRAWLSTFTAKSEHSAAVQASEKLRKPEIRAYVAKRMKQAFDNAEGASEKLIQTYLNVAYADANELVEYRRDSCRFCHGKDHLYQFTPQEMRDRRAQWEREAEEAENDGKDMAPFDELGGVGFNPKNEPHPECPECHGEGKGRVLFKDTRNLSPAGLSLYAGAKIGKDGIEIKTASQERAREMLARILKLFEDKTEVNLTLDMSTLEEKFAAKMRAAHERQAQVLAEREGGGE